MIDYKPRVAFMGSPSFAATILESLLTYTHVVAVYTQPPKPSGRGHHMQKTPVHSIAENHNILVKTPCTLKDVAVQEEFKRLDIQISITAAYGLLLPKEILSSPPFGCLNLHGSLLPALRGASPVQHAILQGLNQTGVCLMKMDEGMDTGDLLAQVTFDLKPEETTASLMKKMAYEGAALLQKNLTSYLKGDIQPVPQAKNGISYTSKIESSMGFLDCKDSALVNERKVRALEKCWFFLNDKRIRVLKACVLDPEKVFDFSMHGSISDDLQIICSKGIFCPEIVQKEGGKPLLVKDFLRGFHR